MNRFDELRVLSEEGIAVAKRRGHLMLFTRNTVGINREYVCSRCGAYFETRIAPAPNEVNLSGTALALNCPKEY